MNAREILEMSLNVESLAERIYADLGRMFPEARPLFERLSCEESRHADIVAINMKLLDVDSLPPEFSVDLVPLIRHTIEVASVLDKKIRTGDITLEEALHLSIEMEDAGVEAYFQNVMRGESAHEALNYAKQFYRDSKHHADLIREFREALLLTGNTGRPLKWRRGIKLNCWEFKRCGRQQEGSRTRGVPGCPVTTERRLDGVHGGMNAGRACWVVAGTLCRGETQGTFVEKYNDCRACNFYLKVLDDEGPSFQSPGALLAVLEGP